ncbi:ABC transporter ATP-binding protein [Microbulbifer hydrolyticus]|uniref:ABC transport system ATP-binding protein n=1 Tax=Microbulbifer hydrolyticus TaxID=48074 RepID=A0A6P1T9T7_9GAMM|nr:ATP-binding cassette domain-containing protein [Microbulbifer hydrolyticus]MBB5213221.1 putative ABC transport system ATP-binding protein [Microbulbifer hydrolyticus]QHQ38515.1 ATP-binding cassette domain-containing protein [Microbulbifer hydrolyticus]
MSLMLKAENLHHRVSTSEGPLTLLSDISLQLPAGQSLAITGASGSGKSTLLGLLAGLDRPTEGKIWLAGEEITAMDEEQRAAVRARCVGFVFQTFQLLPGLTARENVMLPSELRGERNAGNRAEEFLERVGLGHRLHHYPRQLSGGEQQRVAIARAFCSIASHDKDNQNGILFADEPTGSLDAHNGEKVIDLLFNLNAETGTTLVLVTHEQRLAERCGAHLRMAAGEITTADIPDNFAEVSA